MVVWLACQEAAVPAVTEPDFTPVAAPDPPQAADPARSDLRYRGAMHDWERIEHDLDELEGLDLLPEPSGSPDELLTLARPLLRDPSPRVRAEAARLVGRSEDPADWLAVAELRCDPVDSPRAAAFHALGQALPEQAMVAGRLDRSASVVRAAMYAGQGHGEEIDPRRQAALANLPPCDPPLPRAYRLDLWSPALGLGPVSVRLLDEEGVEVARAELPASANGTTTITLSPSGIPWTAVLTAGSVEERLPVADTWGHKLTALCGVDGRIQPDEDMKAWVIRGAQNRDCRTLARAPLANAPASTVLSVVKSFHDLVPPEEVHRALRTALTEDPGMQVARDVALRLSCTEQLDLIEELRLGGDEYFHSRAMSCAQRSVVDWLRVEARVQSGVLPYDVLPNPPESKDPILRARVGERLLAAVANSSREELLHALAATEALDGSRSSHLRRLVPLPAPASDGTHALLVLPRPCLGKGRRSRVLVDEVLVLKGSASPPVPEILRLDAAEAQARLVLCGKEDVWRAPRGRAR